MKKNLSIYVLIIIFVAGSAFALVDDVITRLGVGETTARYHILAYTVGNYSSGPIDHGDDEYEDNQFKVPYAKMLKDVVAGDKVAATRELCEYIRSYVNSEEFMIEYNARREDALPLENDGYRISRLRGDIRVHQTNIRNYQSDTKYVAEQQAKLDEAQQRLDQLMEQAKGDFPGRKDWEANFPADPSVLVKNRLDEYLKLVATVDFNAQTVVKDGKTRFVNPVYEKKSNRWKACYRAGKEVNDVVIAFVKNWMKGEIVAKNKIKMPLTVPASNATKSTSASSTTNAAPAATQPGSANTSTSTSNSNPVPAASQSATPAESPATPTAKPAKEKKSLLNKLKEKTKTVTDVIKN